MLCEIRTAANRMETTLEDVLLMGRVVVLDIILTEWVSLEFNGKLARFKVVLLLYNLGLIRDRILVIFLGLSFDQSLYECYYFVV